jgi:pantoate--beta-alanine ligase
VRTLQSIDDVRAAIHAWREAGDRVALVPTMGNLHKGHLSLVELASQHAEHVIVSVFVNPTQFGPNEDYEDYPRTLETDARKLSRAGVDILFAPAVNEMYPGGSEHSTEVMVPELSAELCGVDRPGHFTGVTSVVCRLFNICTPDVAVFGQKDLQQLVILRRMVADLHLPIELLVGPTVREKSGLAMSSRNGKLDDVQKDQAAILCRALERAADTLRTGTGDAAAIEHSAVAEIEAAGLAPEYFSVRALDDLSVPTAATGRLAVLTAARLGSVRLIDNIVVDLID